MDYGIFIGKNIQFTKMIEDMEAYAESGMRARIVSIVEKDTSSADLHDHIYKITFDYSEFDEFNKRYESADYYDDRGKAVLTAREANQYSVQETIYFGSDKLWPWKDYFRLLDENQIRLQEQFRDSGETDYVAWLEKRCSNL